MGQERTSANEKSLNQILRDTIATIENSKSQIFEIYETARNEVETTRHLLEEIKLQTAQTIAMVDQLEKLEQQGKQDLVRVSSNFANYSEERIRHCYEAVKNVQIRLSVAREKEYQLRTQRDKCEMRLVRLQKTLASAERLAMRIGSVLGYLSSQISDAVAQIELAAKNKFIGAQIIKAQEEERYRVSREIHDGPAQDMANLIYQATITERLIDMDPEEAKQSIQELKQQIRACLTDIRQIIFDMRPMSLDDLGFIPAVRQLIVKLRDRGVMEASFQTEGKEQDIPKHIGVALFRIVQEALNNVNRHAGTKKAKVRVLFTDAALSVLIVDEGEGFDMEQLDEEYTEGDGHFGIVGMKERAAIIGAELSVVSAKGKGTRVHLRLPFSNNETDPDKK